jgi:hypothetical protein
MFFGITIQTSLGEATAELGSTKAQIIELKQENVELKRLIEKGY